MSCIHRKHNAYLRVSLSKQLNCRVFTTTRHNRNYSKNYILQVLGVHRIDSGFYCPTGYQVILCTLKLFIPLFQVRLLKKWGWLLYCDHFWNFTFWKINRRIIHTVRQPQSTKTYVFKFWAPEITGSHEIRKKHDIKNYPDRGLDNS